MCVCVTSHRDRHTWGWDGVGEMGMREGVNMWADVNNYVSLSGC